MNPVSMPVVPTLPAKPGNVASNPASREEQAAFSPALMMMLAAGLGPVPVLPPVVAEAQPAAAPGPLVATIAPAALPAVTNVALTASPAAPEIVKPSPSRVAAPAPAVVANPGLPELAANAAAVAPATGRANPIATARPQPLPLPDAKLPSVAPQVPEASASTSPDAAIAHNSAVVTTVTQTQQAPIAAPIGALAAAAAAQRATQQVEPDAHDTPAAQAAPSEVTGAAVVEVARRAAATAANPVAQQPQQPGSDGKSGTGDGTAGRNAAAARGAKSGAGSRAPGAAAAAVVAPAAATPAAPAAAIASPVTPAVMRPAGETTDAHAVAGPPHDPRLDPAGPANVRGTRSDQVTLRVEGDQGVEARLRVAVRGSDLRATIVADDPALARRLEEGIGNLRQALGERGFERTSVVVQSTTTARGNAGDDTARDSQPQRRQPDAGSSGPNGRRSDTPDQRSRRRDGRDADER